jgi:hypothetical protein
MERPGCRWAVPFLCAVFAACVGDLHGGPPPPASPPSRPVTLPAEEVVRRLSELLFRAPPDAALMAQASRFDLTKAAGVAELARAMLRDARAVSGVDAFVSYWLGIEELPRAMKDAAVYPSWTAALGEDMVAEVHGFVRHVILEGDGRFASLLTLPLAFANERLAAIYGFGDVRGSDLRQVTHDGKMRAGLLGLPGVIAWRSRAGRTYPSRRGNFVAYRFACRTVFISDFPDPIFEGRTMRDVQDEATSYSGCQICHHLMNPPGWAFERFDSVGALRTTDVGLAVDSSGKLPPDLLDTAADVPIDGIPDLARAIAGSARAQTCHAFFWLTFAMPAGDTFTAAGKLGEAPGLDEIASAFRASGGDLRALIAAVASSAQFLAP